MMRVLLFFAAAFFLLGCKKVKENIMEEQALSFLDGTEWKVVAFSDGTTNLDAAFQPFYFRFNRDETVHAIRSNSTEATGTWKGNIANRTIQAKFSSGTVHPLPLLTSTWTIIKSTPTTLSAAATVGGVERKLSMEKL